MNKTYKYTLTAHEKKEISFDTGVARLAITNGDGVDGSTTVIMSEITKQHSGDIVSFIDGADAPFADFIVNIVGYQSGSGAPSPGNVRPITGWTGANVYVSGEDTSNPTIHNINWQSTAGTIYQGTLDVLTGVLTVYKAVVDMGSLNWTYQSTYSSFVATVDEKFIIATGTPYDYGLLTSIYPAVNYWWTNTFKPDKSISNGAGTNIVVKDSSYTSAEDFKTAMVGQQLAFELENPATYQLTPTEIRSLLGINNVWADCGPVNVRYFVQSTQPMIDYINDEDDKCVYIDCEQTGQDTFSITSAITKAEFVSLLNKDKNVKLRLDTGSGDIIFDLSVIDSNFADFTYNRTALISDINSFQSMTLRVDMSGDTLSLSRHAVITIGDGSYEYVTGQNNQLIKDGWSWSTQGYSLTDADELLFMITPMPNVASDSDTIYGELQRSSSEPKRALFCKGIKNMLPDVQEIESPFWFNDIVVVGNRATHTDTNDIIMKIRVWARYYSEPVHTLLDVNFYADCDCSDSTANLWGMCNIFVFKKRGGKYD